MKQIEVEVVGQYNFSLNLSQPQSQPEPLIKEFSHGYLLSPP